jgi:hypothetical protein
VVLPQLGPQQTLQTGLCQLLLLYVGLVLAGCLLQMLPAAAALVVAASFLPTFAAAFSQATSWQLCAAQQCRSQPTQGRCCCVQLPLCWL